MKRHSTRHPLSRVLASLCLLAVSVTGAAQATAAEGWNLDLGVGAIVNPEFQGADEYQIRPVPFFDARYSDDRGELLFANVPQGIGGYVYRRGDGPGRSTRVALAIGPGFATRDNEIPGLEEIDMAAEARLSLQIDRGAWAGSARIAQDLGTGHEGAYLDLGLERRGRIGRRGFWSLGPNLRIVDRDYAAAQYGVDAAGAAASGLAQHRAGSGIEQIRLQALTGLPLGEVWRLTTLASVGRLVGGRSQSPIVASKTQFFALLALTRPVGGRAAP